ncbi:MAG: 50S ribosomal protein L21 [Dehalococcoidia bacterium]|nr:50S ribosomal protein L21 [Dehalococcoidia bacterium]|tara:strand:- start:39613 stop:39933 length:321 start_codon:yes stop_codon:yes gene_type:complete
MDYAIFKSGGKQYRVSTGDTLDIEKITAEVGSIAEFGEVLALSNNGELNIGTPTVEGAKVLAEVKEQRRDRKIIVFKYKSKTRYRRKLGHRQSYTRVTVQDIQAGD